MSKKVLVIAGNSRKDANSDILRQQFARRQKGGACGENCISLLWTDK